MDIFYHVKQLAHEIAILEAQIAEKKASMHKLFPALTHQEQLLVDSPSTPPPTASPGGKSAAPKESKK